jgi:hypothetical protein
MTKTRILLVGLGSLGSLVLDLLLRINSSLEVLVASRNEDTVHQRTNLAMLAALQLGHRPHVSSTALDVSNVSQSAALIARFRPDIIFSSVCLQSWWVIGGLPKPIFDRLDQTQVGPWLPMHLTLLYKLMQAVRDSGHRPIVVNASYPDVTHPILDRIGLAPDIGIGNVSNAVPGLRMSLSYKLGIPTERIQLRFFAHHYVSHRVSKMGNAGKAPFHVTVYVDGKDVTRKFDTNTVFDLMATRFKRSGGVNGQLITATSAIDVLRAIILDEQRIVHAPGPNGLPGGYAVEVGRNRREVALPESLSLAEAVRVNEEGMRFDGVDKIGPDGTAWFTQKEMSIMADMIGYSRESMHPDESEECARELLTCYGEFQRRCQLTRAARA